MNALIRAPASMSVFGVLCRALAACSTAQAADAGPDGAPDAQPDLCDLDRFFDAGGSGGRCPFASTRLCFHGPKDCPATGCKCASMPSGPTWQCTTDFSCKDSGADASEDAEGDASTDSAADAPVD